MDMERCLVCQGNIITTCCSGIEFNSGRVERVAKNNLKRFSSGDVDSRNYGLSGRFFGKFGLTPAGAIRFSLVLCRYVSIPRVVWIAIDGIVGKGGMSGAIRGVFTGKRGMGLCGRFDRMSQRPRWFRLVFTALLLYTATRYLRAKPKPDETCMLKDGQE
jgi:hypothetical protein